MTTAADGWPASLPARQVRFARPTDRLDEVVRFYRDGLGLRELFRFEGHAGYDGVMLGLPDAAYHLEFTSHIDGSPGPAPTRDNLIVFYLDGGEQVAAVAERLAGLGYKAVEPENPWWAESGAVTVPDPDGWHIVLMPTPGFEA